MTSSNLATLIAKRITTDAPITYSTLEARAIEKNIDLSLFEEAMAIIHRSKLIEAKNSDGDIVYSIVVPKIAKPGPVRPSYYPDMDSSNDGSGIEADFSYLFLSPEELDKYKAEVKGVAYIPKKRYANTRK